MTSSGYTLFDTPIGRCGVAWTGRGIVAVQLPEARDDRTGARLLERAPDAVEASPPAEVRRAIDGIVALLNGQRVDLSSVTLDMDTVSEFHRRVYRAARTIPAGTTRSYGDLAAQLGDPGAARAVGRALGANPYAIVVPCHRVLAAGGRIGGFSAHGGITMKRRVLAIEGVPSAQQLALFDPAGGG